MEETWKQILTIIVANFAIIWWFRRESRDDWKMCTATIEAIRSEMKEFREDVRIEMKDFHERLLKIEMDRK